MIEDRVAVLQEASRILGYILKEELSEEEKDRIIHDSIENFNEHVNPGWLKYRKSVSTDAAFVEWEDSQETFKDTHGTEFIDCLGGFGIYTAGHRNPEIVQAVQAQLNRYALHSQELVDPLRGYLAKLLSMCTPGDLQYAFFCNGGAEANEMALKLARLASGKHYFISTVNGFHGKSMGAVSATGKAAYRRPYLPLIQGVQHVEFGNADAAESAIKNLIAVGETVAAMIVEPIQGEAGIVLPPHDYLNKLRDICDTYDVFLILDEIQTGMAAPEPCGPVRVTGWCRIFSASAKRSVGVSCRLRVLSPDPICGSKNCRTTPGFWDLRPLAAILWPVRPPLPPSNLPWKMTCRLRSEKRVSISCRNWRRCRKSTRSWLTSEARGCSSVWSTRPRK